MNMSYFSTLSFTFSWLWYYLQEHFIRIFPLKLKKLIFKQNLTSWWIKPLAYFSFIIAHSWFFDSMFHYCAEHGNCIYIRSVTHTVCTHLIKKKKNCIRSMFLQFLYVPYGTVPDIIIYFYVAVSKRSFPCTGTVPVVK